MIQRIGDASLIAVLIEGVCRHRTARLFAGNDSIEEVVRDLGTSPEGISRSGQPSNSVVLKYGPIAQPINPCCQIPAGVVFD